jgi:hypothetical protein
MTRSIDAASLGIDPGELEELLEGETASKKHGRRLRTDRHIGAPVPFITEVCLLTEGRSALVVALCIFRRVCVCDSWTVTLPNDELASLGVNRRRKQEALVKLQDADLIKVKNATGHTARITLLWRPGSPSVGEDT